MKSIFRLSLFAALLCSRAVAQNVADPLSFQGLEQYGPMSARTRAMGGSVVAVGNDVGAMFSNPAVLSGLSSFETRTYGAMWKSTSYEQAQRWIPNRYYADMSLMFENRLGGIKDVDPELVTNPTDNLHHPFDTLTPNWDKNLTKVRPSIIAGGIPFTIAGMRIAAGLGYTEMINFDHYYQNNNAISPNLGQYRPAPIPLVVQGDTLVVQWYQYVRQRQGIVYGITPALSINPLEGLHLGVSFAILTGSTDDYQLRNDRGRLRLFYNSYLLDSAINRVTTTGTSSYTGTVPTIGMIFAQDYYSLGISIRPGTTITRTWVQTVQTVTRSGERRDDQRGVDKLELPVFTTVGVALHPTPKWNIGIDYVVQNFSEASFLTSQGSALSPWVDSKVFRVGTEFAVRKWFDLRAGAREEMQAFAPSGEGVIGEPASGAVYGAGFGLHLGRIAIDGSYEYGTLKYNDLWQSNVNTNKIISHTAVLEVGYVFE